MTRMRTIPKAYEEIKALDPNTDLSLKALRKLVKDGDIPSVQIASKTLVNFDLVIEVLSCYNKGTSYATLCCVPNEMR